MSKAIKKLTKEDKVEIRRLSNEEKMHTRDIEEKYGVSRRTIFETVNNITEKEIYKLYYEGLTPKFIALKLGVSEQVILGWLYIKGREDGYVNGKISQSYTWEQHKADLTDKGKKVCHTKAEQEAKINRQLGDEVVKALKREKMLNTEVLAKVANKIGYKDMKYFKRAIQVYGLMTDELEGIFNKM